MSTWSEQYDIEMTAMLWRGLLKHRISVDDYIYDVAPWLVVNHESRFDKMRIEFDDYECYAYVFLDGGHKIPIKKRKVTKWARSVDLDKVVEHVVEWLRT